MKNKISKTNTSISDHEVLSLLFHEQTYLSINSDVREAGADPFDHYINYGFQEGRALPSSSDENILPLLENDNGTGIETKLTSIGQVADTLRSWPVDSPFGPSTLLCPAWLMQQLQVPLNTSFIDLMRHEIPKGPFSIHPGFSRFECPEKMSLAALHKLIRPEDMIANSYINLEEFIQNHKDLSGIDSYQAISIAWSIKAKHNRLKYLGNTRPAKRTQEHAFLSQCATVYRHILQTTGTIVGASRKSLLPHKMRRLTPGEPMEGALQSVLTAPANPEHISMQALSNIQKLIESNEAIVLSSPIEVSSSEQSTDTRIEITDRDLLSGAYKLETKRVVYCVNLGGYDSLPIHPDLDDCTYFLISDAPRQSIPSPWIIVRPTINEQDVKRQCLWYKTHPHLLFSDAEFSIWIDSNIECQPHASEILQAHETLSEVATFVHPDRSCVYEEAQAISDLKLDRPDVIKRAVFQMKQKGLPIDYGLFETNVLFSRIQDLAVRDFFDKWWYHIALGSRRDQMSFTFAAWQEGISITNLDANFSAKNSRYFSKRSHMSKEGRFV